MSITKRSIIAMAGAATFALTSIPTSVAAADFEPTKPVDFVIMAGVGGGADQIARFIQSLTEKMGLMSRPLVPNNKRVSVLLCMTDLAHASKLKEHDDNDDFQGTTGRAA